MAGFDTIENKMELVGLSRAAIDAFRHAVQTVESGESGLIGESSILPARDVAEWDDLTAATPEADRELIAQCVCIKLNGGLGTSMGLQKAKSLLPIQKG